MAEEIIKPKLVLVRANFVGDNTPEMKAKGYFKNVYYDLWIKQDGHRFLCKRADERTKGESKVEYESLWDMTEEWTFRFKYIR